MSQPKHDPNRGNWLGGGHAVSTAQIKANEAAHLLLLTMALLPNLNPAIENLLCRLAPPYLPAGVQWTVNVDAVLWGWARDFNLSCEAVVRAQWRLVVPWLCDLAPSNGKLIYSLAAVPDDEYGELIERGPGKVVCIPSFEHLGPQPDADHRRSTDILARARKTPSDGTLEERVWFDWDVYLWLALRRVRRYSWGQLAYEIGDGGEVGKALAETDRQFDLGPRPPSNVEAIKAKVKRMERLLGLGPPTGVPFGAITGQSGRRRAG